MSLSAIGKTITTKFGRQVLVAQKHSPVLLLGTGIAGFVGTVVLAVRATPKMEEILKETEEKVEAAKALQHELYSEMDRKKDITTVYVQSAIKVIKTYAPVFIVGAIAIGAFTGSHVILTRRNAGLAAAYTAIHEAFNKYRERVVSEFGAEKDLHFKHGLVTAEYAVDTDQGVSTQTVTHFDPNGRSAYSVIFDEFNPNYSSNPDSNHVFVVNVQNQLNDLLKRRGHVFLNEARHALGFCDVPEGQIVGWLLKDGYDKGDGYISLGLDNPATGDFVFGPNKSALLDFNVDGPIYALI